MDFLQSNQLQYLRGVMKIPKSTPTVAAFHLDLGNTAHSK